MTIFDINNFYLFANIFLNFKTVQFICIQADPLNAYYSLSRPGDGWTIEKDICRNNGGNDVLFWGVHHAPYGVFCEGLAVVAIVIIIANGIVCVILDVSVYV